MSEPVSPADAIRAALEALESFRSEFSEHYDPSEHAEDVAALAALLAVGERDKAEIAELRLMLKDAEADVDAGERDRRQIAQLTEALREWHELNCGCDRPGNPAACICDPIESAAVLADKEDAGDG